MSNSIRILFVSSSTLHKFFSVLKNGTSEKVEFTDAEGNPFNWLSIHCIIEDNQGYLWIATEQSGLIKYHPESGESKLFIHDKNDTTSIPGNALNFVFEDSKNRLWIGSDENGLGILNNKERRLFNP